MKTVRASGKWIRHDRHRSTIRDRGRSDHRAELQVIRHHDPQSVGEIDPGSQGCTARTCVNEDWSTVSCRPCAIFESLVTSADEPRPRLVDGEKTHQNP